MGKYLCIGFLVLSTLISRGEIAPELITKHANQIDTLVASELRNKRLKMPKGVDDTTLCRRVYLDIVGRPPTSAELRDFLKSKERPALIKKLINSKGYVHHMYSFWADLLRVKRDLNDNVGQLYGDAYIEWLKEQIRANTPYNKLTKDLLGANGNIWENPATGYLLRDLGMPLDNLSNTTQIFLGIDMACAQCHDHPFDDWTQMDFYKTAAFFAQVQTKNSQDGVKQHIKELREEAKKMQQFYKNPFESIHRTGDHDTVHMPYRYQEKFVLY